MSAAGLAEFLAARLDEGEATARANIGTGPGWQHGLGDTGSGGLMWPDYQTYDSEELTAAEAYLNHFRPVSALHDIEADRKLLAAYAEVADMDRDDPEPEYAYGRAAGLGEAVRLRAARFSGHPDYDQDWKPS